MASTKNAGRATFSKLVKAKAASAATASKATAKPNNKVAQQVAFAAQIKAGNPAPATLPAAVAAPSAMAQMAATLPAAVAAQPPATAQVVKPAPANAIAHPKLTFTWPTVAQVGTVLMLHPQAKPYGGKVGHTAACWAICAKTIAQAGGKTTWQALCNAGVPSHFVGYMVRNAKLQVVAA